MHENRGSVIMILMVGVMRANGVLFGGGDDNNRYCEHYDRVTILDGGVEMILGDNYEFKR